MAHPWTQSRRDIFTQQYRLPADRQAEVDQFFIQADALAASCADQGQFERQFAARGLDKTYADLMTKNSEYFTVGGQMMSEKQQQIKEEQEAVAAQEHVKSMAEQAAYQAVMRVVPDEVKRVKFGGLRVLPVIGPIVQWIDNIKWIRRMMGKN